MDELDLLKKDWDKQFHNKKISAKEIYTMLHKKSSSIVKTLFYISIGELMFWILVSFVPYLTSEDYQEKLNVVYPNDFMFTVITIISFAIVIIFILLLYRSYKSISVTANSKKLMESILKTRKIIKYYVLYNLIVAGISFTVGIYYAIKHDPTAINSIENIGEYGLPIFLFISTIFIVIFIVVFWLFYKLLYGLLLKRLNNNYAELSKLEI